MTDPTRPARPPLTSLDDVARALGVADGFAGVEISGVTLDSRSAPQARAFVAYLLSADGQRILRKWGFRSAR